MADNGEEEILTPAKLKEIFTGQAKELFADVFDMYQTLYSQYADVLARNEILEGRVLQAEGANREMSRIHQGKLIELEELKMSLERINREAEAYQEQLEETKEKYNALETSSAEEKQGLERTIEKLREKVTELESMIVNADEIPEDVLQPVDAGEEVKPEEVQLGYGKSPYPDSAEGQNPSPENSQPAELGQDGLPPELQETPDTSKLEQQSQEPAYQSQEEPIDGRLQDSFNYMIMKVYHDFQREHGGELDELIGYITECIMELIEKNDFKEGYGIADQVLSLEVGEGMLRHCISTLFGEKPSQDSIREQVSTCCATVVSMKKDGNLKENMGLMEEIYNSYVSEHREKLE